MSIVDRRRAAEWNPKRLGTVKSTNGPHETELWAYLQGRRLELVIQVNEGGIAKGITVHTIRLPRWLCPK